MTNPSASTLLDRPTPAQAPQQASIQSLWYTRCAVPTASSLAFQQGWLQDSFADIGIALDSVRSSEDDAVRNSHYDNSLRNQFREGGNVPPIWARSKGAPTVVVGVTWVDEFQAIVTRPGADIQSLAGLKGKRLGLPLHPSELVDHGRASALHGFVSALGLVGLKAADVAFVDLQAQRSDIREDKQTGVLSAGAQRGGGAVLQALREGVIDAAYVKGPGGIKQVREQGLHVLYDLTTHPDPLVHVNNAVPRPVTVDRDLLAHRPELIVRYLTVLLRVGRWAKDHPADVRRLVAHETGSSEDDTATAYGPDLHHHLLPTLDDTVVAGLQRQKDFLWDRGFLPQNFDFASWIAPEPLAEARRLLAAQG